MKTQTILKKLALGLLIVLPLQACAQDWESQKSTFMTACQEGAKGNAQLEPIIDKYCGCMFDKLKEKYKTPAEVPTGDDAMNKVMSELAPTCLTPLMEGASGGDAAAPPAEEAAPPAEGEGGEEGKSEEGGNDE